MSAETVRKKASKNIGRSSADIPPPAPPEVASKRKNILQHRKAKKKGGRPPAITEEEVRKLEAAFCNDFTIDESLEYADVKRRTYYDYLKKNEEFSRRIRRAQTYALTLSKRAIVSSIKEGNTTDARWFLERRQPERYRPSFVPEDLPAPNVTVILPGQKPPARIMPPKKDDDH